MAGRRARAVLPSLVAPLLAGCYASNVVASADRAVDELALPSEWHAPTQDDLVGYHASVAIAGAAAASLRKVYYWFAADGTYTGAALIAGDQGLEFQTLVGRWSLTADGLCLDGAAAVPAGAAPGFVRITSPGGELVLMREVLR